MKILLVHNSYQQEGGEDAVVEQESQLLARMGHCVVEYRRSNREIQHYSAFGRVIFARRAVWAADSRHEVGNLLGKHKALVAHVHNTFGMISPSVYSACKDAGVPVVQTLHNYRPLCPAATFFRHGRACEDCLGKALPWPGVLHACYRHSRVETAGVVLMLVVHRWLKSLLSKVDLFIALTEFSRRKFIEGGLPPDKVVVKPNFVYPDPGSRIGGGKYALFVGRLVPEKGLRTLLQAWERLGKGVPLIIAGDGPMRTELESEAIQRHLNRVRFLGWQPREIILEAIKGAHFLLFPSECYETFGITIVEAFACGVPVVASHLGAMAEIVDDGRTGVHFTPGDADDLAEKVEWAWAHPERLEEMGREARAEYEAKYTAEHNYKMLMEIYEQAISTHRVRRRVHG